MASPLLRPTDPDANRPRANRPQWPTAARPDVRPWPPVRVQIITPVDASPSLERLSVDSPAPPLFRGTARLKQRPVNRLVTHLPADGRPGGNRPPVTL